MPSPPACLNWLRPFRASAHDGMPCLSGMQPNFSSDYSSPQSDSARSGLSSQLKISLIPDAGFFSHDDEAIQKMRYCLIRLSQKQCSGTGCWIISGIFHG